MSFGTTGQAPITGNACTIWIVQAPTRVLLIAGAWIQGQPGSWRAPEHTDGLLGGQTPNAALGSDGKLTARAATPIQLHPKTTVVPRVTHTIGASGWAGGVHLHETLTQAIARLGSPSTELAVQLGCQFSWPGLHLSAVFGFGHGTSNTVEPCNRTAIALAFTGATTWSTAQGLRVGDPESDIALRYPGAGHSTSADVTTWYLSPRHASNAAVALTAEATLGEITAITVSSTGSTVYGVFG
jgi:hypothetical protein